MWKFWGNRFSWSRTQDGRCNIWLYPKAHFLALDMSAQHPDFEYDEVDILNNLEAYLVISEGDGSDTVREVQASHRFARYSVEEEDEIVDSCCASVSIIDKKICVEIRLGSELLCDVLKDLVSVASRTDGYFILSTSSRFVDLTRSFGVRPDAKKMFLAGDFPAILWGELRFSYGFGEHPQN